MKQHFIEASNGPNHGKFLILVYDVDDWDQRTALPGYEHRRLLPSLGWSRHFLWLLDLQTGEGATFSPGGLARADLQKHRIWVCPLYEPLLEWLYVQHREYVGDRDYGLYNFEWVKGLPSFVELPDAPFDFAGYRRPGPQA
ncbi:MAG: hypothetical protein ABWY93_04830 [Mycobacterium sp.]